VYKQILIDAKLQIGKRGLKTESSKEVKVHIGLQGHLRRRKRGMGRRR
jgi:hypothetical protein